MVWCGVVLRCGASGIGRWEGLHTWTRSGRNTFTTLVSSWGRSESRITCCGVGMCLCQFGVGQGGTDR